MPKAISFALNHMTAPRLPLDAFFALASALGFRAVEIRNDIEGQAIADGTPAEAVAASAVKADLRIISINALQRFNDWSEVRAREAQALASYARRCGAEALVLCPVNDTAFRPSQRDRLEGLRRALWELKPILAAEGVAGLVEPLGFPESSLRLKREAVNAIDAVGGREIFRLVHDTFHHAVAGESDIFPDRTGLVHASGVEGATPIGALRDPDRVLVGRRDRIDNKGQIRRLRDGGYAGFVSFEPFAESVHALSDIEAELRESAAFLTGEQKSAAA